MINLLPPEIKKELILEKKRRLVAVLGVTMFVPFICLMLVLLSVKLYVSAEVDSQKTILEQTRKQYQTSDFLAFKDIIQKDNKTLSNLESFYKKEIYTSDILKMVSDIPRPENLYLTDLSLNRDDNQKIKVTISGFSKSRDDLLVFQKNIQGVTQIKNLSFSPESWVNPVNVKFNLVFEVSP